MRTLIFLLAIVVPFGAQASDPLPLTNWAVPGRSEGQVSAMADISDAAIFVAVNPCRVVDTRNADGPYGGPKPTSGAKRTFDIDSGPCAGIPAGAAAFSLNFGVTETAASGYLTAWNAVGTQPVVATMTWFAAGQTLSTAGIVPANDSGAIDVYTAAATHLTIDINGYFMDSGGDLNFLTKLWIDGRISGSPVLQVRNSDASSNIFTSSAIRGIINTPFHGPTAILGEQNNTSGTNYAVRGNNASVSAGAAAVFGRSGTANWPSQGSLTAGVRGIAGGASVNIDSFSFLTSVGVLGEGQNIGVAGFSVDSTGARQSAGYVGYGTTGLYTPNDLSVGGTKSFVEPHPTDASLVIKYVALEGPEAGTYFRGRAKIRNGFATIEVPESFRMVTDEEGMTVQVTPIGQMAEYAVVSFGLDRIVVRASREIEFFYFVQGVRKAFKDFEPVQAAERDGFFVPRGPHDRLDRVAFDDEAKRRLIANGTFNEDGSVNLGTAERLGWAQAWRERDAAIAAYQASQPVDPSEQPASPRQ